jgi:hypothetical protein
MQLRISEFVLVFAHIDYLDERTMSDNASKPAIPAYAPYKSFMSFVRQLGEHDLPSHIDRSVLNKMSGSQQSSILGSLQYLALIEDDGAPTEALKKLVKASGPEFSAALRDTITAAYSFVFNNGLNLKTTTTSKVESSFRSQGVSGSTVSKCIAFFLACCKDAGIEVSRFVKTPAVATTGRISRRNASDRDNEIVERDDEAVHYEQPEAPEVHPAIAGLFRELPPAGQPWPKAGRTRFLAAFTAILDFVYPEEETK